MGDIVVLVKPALNPDMVRAKPDGTVDIDAIPLKLDDIDANALFEAQKLKKILGGKIAAVLVLTWGPAAKRAKDLRMVAQEALARGADEAHIVADDSIILGDPITTSSAVIATIKKAGLRPDIILVAEASIDQTTGQIAGRIAGKLGLPFISFARKLEVKDGRIVAERDLEEHIEVLEAPLPAVVSVTQEINEPRPPTLIQIRRAGKKPQNYYGVGDLDEVIKPVKEGLEYKILTVSRKQTIIEGDNLEEVAEKLINVLEKEGVLKL